ncbi:MAG: S-layer homology domain-containing protein [Clostridia bacterium]|nr:S-layer homology domain-containing protein [Clostridia bacterium]
MKKLVSVLLAVIMVVSFLPVLAEELDTQVLLEVKSRVDIPSELTEFSYGESTYDNVLRYDFFWNDKDHKKEIYITSDSKGRIVSYNRYESMDYSSDRSLIGYNSQDAQTLAEAFVKKAFAEFFASSTDTLVLDTKKTTSSYSGRYKTFSFTFNRVYNSEKAESNFVSVRVRATKDTIYVQSVNASLDDEFDVLSETLVNTGEAEYIKQFPIKLYYATDYYSENGGVTLFYTMDKGFVSRADGSVVTKKHFDRYAEYGAEDSVMTESTAGGAANKNTALTPEEKKALEENESLVKAETVAAMLSSIEILGIDSDMKIASTNINKYEEKYYVRFTLKNDTKTTNVTYMGKTGEVTSIYTYFSTAKAKDEAAREYTTPTGSIEAFVRTLSSSKIDETKKQYSTSADNDYAELTAVRLVNNVEYPENSINVTYDFENSLVTRYSISWDEDVSSFPKPEEAIGINNAQAVMFDISPLYNTLVKTEDGYVHCVTIPQSVTLYAISGTNLNHKTGQKVKYTDIDSHWAKNEIEVLWEHDIYLEGDKFKPDEAVNQADMVLLFSACRDSGIVPVSWAKGRISAYAAENKYVEKAEPDKLMTRREAFEVMCSMLGYGDVAAFDIYKSSYTDLERCGSAEILKAMGVLTGDTARPDDYLTRAEAAVMVYRYLSR